MKNENQLWLYLVSNPVPFKNVEDHIAALEIRLHELVENAIKENEDPILLIEEILQVSYNGAETIDEIANFIALTDTMHHALSTLKENWNVMDDTIPEESLRYFSNTTKQQAHQLFSQITLRTYLEALSTVYDQKQ